jgi:hypothetical protein
MLSARWLSYNGMFLLRGQASAHTGRMAPVNDPGYAAAKQARYRARKRAAEESDPVESFVRAAIVTGLATLEQSRPCDVARRANANVDQ